MYLQQISQNENCSKKKNNNKNGKKGDKSRLPDGKNKWEA